MKYVKLTDESGETFNHTKWAPGVVHHARGQGALCGDSWIYCYGSDTESRAALLAVLLNPLHCNFQTPRGWRVECKGEILPDNGLNFGTTEMKCLEEIILPNVTTTQRVAFAILCAMKVYKNPGFQTWAQAWLSGSDRSEATAWAVAEAVLDTAWAPAWLSGYDRSVAAAAGWAATAVWVAATSPTPTSTPFAKSRSPAEASSWAASWASWAADTSDLDLGSIAEEAMSY